MNVYLYKAKMPMQLLTGIMEKSGLEGVFLNPVKEPLKKKKLPTAVKQIKNIVKTDCACEILL